MLRLTTLATIASVVMAHSLREGPHYCSELTPEGTVRPECADPAWVTKYSQPLNGAGPEQVSTTSALHIGIHIRREYLLFLRVYFWTVSLSILRNG
jgi:hypothetical protein